MRKFREHDMANQNSLKQNALHITHFLLSIFFKLLRTRIFSIMAFRTSHLALLALIVAYLCVDVRSAATNGTAGATEQVKDGTASGQASASADAKPSELHGARDEFVGGVAAIGDSARRAGQAVVNKAAGVRDNLQDAGHKISENIGQSWQNTKDIVSNIGNTDTKASAGAAASARK